MLFNKPHNIDDCLDLHKTKNIANVDVELKVNTHCDEMYIVEHLIASYTFNFKDFSVNYEKIHGGILPHQSMKKKQKSLYSANKSLEETLSRIKDYKITINIKENKFSNELAYN